MKRLYVSMISFVVSLAMAFSPVFAADTTDTKIANAITKLKSYYTTNNTLSSADDIIAVESLGMQAESDTFKLADSLKTKLSTLGTTTGTLSKQIIALKLLGDDPTNYNGNNYVKALEDKIGTDGSTDSKYASNDAWVVYALYKANQLDEAKIVANHLETYLTESTKDNKTMASSGYTDDKGYHIDIDTTAWIATALYLVDSTAYSTKINEIFNAIDSTYSSTTGAYTGQFGGNADTQASALEAYFVADKDNYLKSDKFSGAIDYFATQQNEEGSFIGYNSALASFDAARCLGTYENGTVFSPTRIDTVAKPDDTKKDDTKKDETKKSDESKTTTTKKGDIVTTTNADSTTTTNNATNKATVKTKTGYSVKYKTKVSYTGKVVKPVTKVSFDGKALKLNKDYKITYSKNAKAIGKHTLTVKGLNEYKDLKVKKSFTVVPAKVANVKVTAKAKKLVVSYKKVKGSVKYQIKVTYKKAKTIKTKKTKVTVQSLKVKKTYKVKVRAYKKVGKKTYYGSWSKTKSVKTK